MKHWFHTVCFFYLTFNEYRAILKRYWAISRDIARYSWISRDIALMNIACNIARYCMKNIARYCSISLQYRAILYAISRDIAISPRYWCVIYFDEYRAILKQYRFLTQTNANIAFSLCATLLQLYNINIKDKTVWVEALWKLKIKWTTEWANQRQFLTNSHLN